MADAMKDSDSLVGMDEIFSGTEEKVAAIPAPHDALASHIRSVWQTNWEAKQVVEQRELANERRWKGEYDAERLSAIKEAGLPEDTLRMTYHKCRDCASWMLDTIDPLGDRTWDVEADSKIEIPPEMKDQLIQQKQIEMLQAAIQLAQQAGQQLDPYQTLELIRAAEPEIIELIVDEAKMVAEERCTNMEQLIMSQLHEGGWDEAYKACVDDFSRRKATFMKGPLPKNVKAIEWDNALQGYKAINKVVPGFWRINSFDAYPAPNALNPNDGPFIELEHHDVTDLSRLIGVKGYDGEAIRKVLQRFPKGRKEVTPIDQERKWLENENMSVGQDDVPGGKIDGLYFWGDVQGKMLREWGMKEKDVADEDIYYPVRVRMIDDIIIQAKINPDPLGINPYDSASFVKNNDSIWGESPCDLMEGIEVYVRATIRSMMYNIAISSAPVWEIDESRLSADDNGDVYPNKQMLTTNKRFMEGPGLRMIQAKLNAAELLMVFDKLKKEADDQVVPAFANTAGGGERTTSALGMRMSAAGRNINMAIDNLDQGIIQKKIQRLFIDNMLNVDDPSIKGATRIVARSTKSQSAREQIANRQMEFIDRISRNGELAGITGKKGMAYGLGEAAKGFGWSITKLIPNLEAIEKSSNPPVEVAPPGEQAPAANGQTLDAAGSPAGGVESQKGPTQ